MHDEQAMRAEKVPSFDTAEELQTYIVRLVEGPHDYGTCVYAMSMAATAAFNYAAHKLGVTGFQASCADMDILRRTRGWEWGKILNYDDLLYPQYCNAEHYPGYADLLAQPDVQAELSKRAKAKLAETTEHTSGAVIDHWKRLAAYQPEPAP